MGTDAPLVPEPEGLRSLGYALDPREVLPKYELKVGAARSLAELGGEYTFFTPAVLYLYAGFNDVPLIDFCTCHGHPTFYYKKFTRPIFRGLEAPSNGNADWNRVLWAVRTEVWESLANWLVSLTFTYADDRAVAGVGQQALQVVDPLAADRTFVYTGSLPLVTVHAFGENGSHRRSGLVPGRNPHVDPPRLVWGDPARDMQVFVAALYGGVNPVNARQGFLRREGASEDNH